MDILDIDEVLRNDSFTCLEGKTHDDVSNILRQWKQNQSLLPQNISALDDNLSPTLSESSASFDAMQQNNKATTTTTTTKSFTSYNEPAMSATATAPTNINNNNNNTIPFKINTRTFTRPKRKNVAGLETYSLNSPNLENDDVSNISYGGTLINRQQKPMLNMQIGGLVTSGLQKSLLQDTSPPSSICSSINASFDNMNNSLITSADFTNISFLKTSNSIEYDNLKNDKTINAATENNYTLQDMIRDRQKLESLTMSSEDGTLIKDTNIAQIDDISLLTLSKPTSSCSTMDNSTDSVEAIYIYGTSAGDQTYEKQQAETINNTITTTSTAITTMNDNKENELKSNSTFNFQEPQLPQLLTTPKRQQQEIDSPLENNLIINETYRKPSIPLMEQTICLSTPTFNAANMTYEKQLPEMFAETSTPESSKPLISLYSNRRNQQRMLDALNEELSPIILHQHTKTNNNNNNKNNKLQQQQQQQSNKIIENINNDNDDNAADITPKTSLASKFDFNDEHQQEFKNVNNTNIILNGGSDGSNIKPYKLMLTDDNVDDVNADFYDDDYDNDDNNKNEIKLRGIARSNERNMQHVRDLAKAEAQYLTGNENEDDFENMLDDIGRIELNPEHLKMKRSLETIKKRLNCALNAKTTTINNDNNEHQHQHQPQEQFNITTIINNGGIGEGCIDNVKNSTAGSGLIIAKSCSSSFSDHDNIITTTTALNSSNTSGSININSNTNNTTTTSERLLSRRSRLYDDANLSTILTASNAMSNNLNVTTTTTTPSSILEKNSIELSYDHHINNSSRNSNNSSGNGSSNNILKHQQQQQQQQEQQFHTNHTDDSKYSNENCAENDNKKYKKLERREHCRNRFKTIKLTKERAENVPCIDDDYKDDDDKYYSNEQQQQNQQHDCNEQDQQQQIEHRYSRHDQHHAPSQPPQTSLLSLYNHHHHYQQQQQNSEAVADTLKYATYKKAKNKPQYSQIQQSYQQQQHNDHYQSQLPDAITTTIATTKLVPNERRSSSRPRYLSGLPKFSLVSKANSTHNLDHDDAKYVPSTTTTQKSKATGENSKIRELRSPMGIKSKSYGSLVTNNAANATTSSTVTTFGLKKGYNSHENAADAIRQQQQQQQQLNKESGFKMLRPSSGIRPMTLKRSVLVRPSSAYYNLNNNMARNGAQVGSTSDMTFASQEPVILSDNNIETLSSGYGSSVRSEMSDRQNTKPMTIYNGKMETKLKPTGISKPSGLRQPTNIKRSALPRPTSYAKR